MTEIALNTSKFLVPTTITMATLCIPEQNQMPQRYYPLSSFSLTDKIWEGHYIPNSTKNENVEKIQIIHNFASQLINETEDIPEEFARILNEDFWDII